MIPRDKAITALEQLKLDAANPMTLRQSPDGGASWKANVREVVCRSLGSDHDLVDKLDKNRYSLSAWSSGTPNSYFDDAFVAGIHRAVGYIDSAIYSLGLSADEPIDETAFDPELWRHVAGLVESEDWAKIPAIVAIFVESALRTWAELDHGTYGKAVYVNALADAGPLRLGSRSGEWEGWRSLGIGFAQGVGNVDRHRLQSRDDAKRYAIGVLGTGSLLLTQLRHQHPDTTSAPVQDLVTEQE